ncbi:TOBE domain-containing protein [Aquabacterium sp. J223]|uniref:TOBE domain-containing protein n=1 Tax=Aquabacterium sp. J223 TaxID=2898431 RepID=UPI0021AE1BB0|nr:TOBE domain-containing protein [Aquabacterium sp. J223]UUX97132.1 TOBE domain-containing protein [Aquabacterium sp. J223]
MPAARRDPATAGAAADGRLTGRLSLQTALGAVLDERGVRLLEAIAEHGALNRAARTVPLSYKAAWDMLQAMDALSPQPLVERHTGGAGGGGMRLTAQARQLVALYRAMQSSQQDVLDRLPPSVLDEAAGGDAASPDAATLRALLRRLPVKSSARNQLPVQVQALRPRGGLVDVVLHWSAGDGDAGDTLVATITPDAATDMALAPGATVFLLVKAPLVRVLSRRPPARPGRNVLPVQVRSIQPGSQHCALRLGAGPRRTLSAVLPRDEARGLAVGDAAWATFDGGQAVLLSFA